jgi:hypothetical protein
MNRRVFIAVLLVVFVVLLPAGLAAQEEEKTGLNLKDKRLGLIFNFIGLADFLIAEHTDNVQGGLSRGGLGMKLWLGEKTAVRALLDLEHTNDSVTTSTWIGASGAFEYHFLQRRVSPYGGGLAGLTLETGAANDLGLYFGALLGAEFELVENLNLFAEYNLLVEIKDRHHCLPELGSRSAPRPFKNTKHPPQAFRQYQKRRMPCRQKP